ncbi:MAG: mechanosensitive ion channel family protein [Chloroflexi bacterium]|nr:mechanosensitive ion channel family protein [Chloroflexota bacterium]
MAEAVQASVSQAMSVRRLAVVVVLVAIVGAALVGVTLGLDEDIFPDFLEAHRGRLVAAEVAVFGIALVELLVKIALRPYERQNARQIGIMIRAVIRTIGYTTLAVATLSILAANPALAVGVGSMTGLVIAFSTQSIIANVFAGMFLAIGRPFRIDDEITVSGSTGKVIEFSVMHTMLETSENIVLIPNSSMLTQVILRSKHLLPRDKG